MANVLAFSGETAIAGINVPLDQAYLIDTAVIKEMIYSYSVNEIEILQRIVEAECSGCDIESKKNVASVILNRIASEEFPNTMKKVVFQEGQFSPVSSGRYWDMEISEETVEAVNQVLEDGVTTTALYFCNYKKIGSSQKKWFQTLNYLFTDEAGHSFYDEE